MLYIITDIEDVLWLQYILEEFSRINLVEFPIQVRKNHLIEEKSGDIIYYVRNCKSGICIPNKSTVTPEGKIQWLSEKIFIIENTLANEGDWSCRYDIFWNTFVFLSRLEEYQSEKNGKLIQSYSFKHPRHDMSTFDIPIVNHLFDELEWLIRKSFPTLRFGQRKNSVIEYSHDVDYIKKTPQLRIKQTAFNGFNALKSISKPLYFIKQLEKTAAFFFSNPSYWCFDYWQEIEKKANVRSVFYVYAKSGGKNLKSWLLDPSYDISENVKLQNKFKYLIDEGFEVGLHGSFHSATDETRLLKEKNLLERAIGAEISKVRQHWLRYVEMLTPYIHNKFFKYDSTLGWNDRMGFRSGIASRYRPYDHKSQKPFDYMVTPQIIMDANIFDYAVDDVECLTKKIVKTLKDIRKFKSGYVSISWHQRVRNHDYGWHGLYEKILFHEGH